MEIFMAIDLGTTGCRCILFDENLEIKGEQYEEYSLITLKENWIEQDASLWWEMTLRTSKEAILKSGIDAKQIKGISVSSQGITIVPVDKNINPLCNALSWLDTRAEAEALKIKNDFENEVIFNLTGKPIEATYTLPKLLWIKENMSVIWKKAWKFLMPMDFIIAKFTGKAVTDHSMASGTLMYDLKENVWSDKILEKYAIPKEKLPSICWSGERVGTVKEDVAILLGLDNDCVVSVGAQDQKCAALGAGLKDGVMTVSLGTAGAVTKLWNEINTEKHNKVGWCGYISPESWVTEGVINTAGTCLRWVRDMLFPGESYDVINNEAKVAQENKSSVLFYPFLNGPSSPYYYPEAEGTFYGLTLAATRGSFALAVMEGVAFQIQILLEEMDAYKNVNGLILFGGGAKSSLWCQIIADITGMKISVPKTEEAAGAGAAILASMACGKTLSGLECKKSYEPSEMQLYYEEKYQKYKKIEKKLWQKEVQM